MSHRLKSSAPCGFHPRAQHFDETFIRLIRNGDYHGIGNIDPKLRELAAEDAVNSTLVAAAAVDWRTTGHKVLNYQGTVRRWLRRGDPLRRKIKSGRSAAGSSFTPLTAEGVILPGLGPPISHGGRYSAVPSFRRGPPVTISARNVGFL